MVISIMGEPRSWMYLMPPFQLDPGRLVGQSMEQPMSNTGTSTLVKRELQDCLARSIFRFLTARSTGPWVGAASLPLTIWVGAALCRAGRDGVHNRLP